MAIAAQLGSGSLASLHTETFLNLSWKSWKEYKLTALWTRLPNSQKTLKTVDRAKKMEPMKDMRRAIGDAEAL